MNYCSKCGQHYWEWCGCPPIHRVESRLAIIGTTVISVPVVWDSEIGDWLLTERAHRMIDAAKMRRNARKHGVTPNNLDDHVAGALSRLDEVEADYFDRKQREAEQEEFERDLADILPHLRLGA